MSTIAIGYKASAEQFGPGELVDLAGSATTFSHGETRAVTPRHR